MTDELTLSPGLCLNCGQPLLGHFCSHCGQKDHGRDLTLKTISHDVLHDMLHVDSKILGTLRCLFLKPGFLTAEYLSGKRSRYVPPFRLYIFISFVLFTLLALNPAKVVQVHTSATPSKGLSFTTGGPASAVKAPEAPAAPESQAQATKPAWQRRLVKELEENPAAFQEHLIHRLGQTAFLLLPVFALLLKLLYLRRHRFFVEHVIFSLHFHAFTFCIAALLQVLFLLPEGAAVVPAILLFLTPPIYLVLAMKNLYGQSWKITGLKAAVALTAYPILIFGALLGTVLLTAALA